MQTHAQAPAEQTQQHKLQQTTQTRAQLFAQPQAAFEDARPEATQLQALQLMMAASPQQQKMQALQAKMAARPLVQRIEEEELLQGKFQSAQLMEDEELLQGKFETAQLMEEKEPLQGKFSEAAATQLAEKPNNTGLPNQLKAGIESLSGMSMDHVKVHYNSDKPAQLNAHAYAQGSDIHVAAGQEQHLPHEAWHVVQQAQGRVKPTVQMKGGVPVNDDIGLEGEADVMGAKALQRVESQNQKPAALQKKLAATAQIINNKPAAVQRLSSSDEELSGDEVLDDEQSQEEDSEAEEIGAFLADLTGRPTASYEVDLYLTAHGYGSSNAKKITDAQKKYQLWLSSVVSAGEIMNYHRSIGFEYEFATYNAITEGLNVDSHQDLGWSKQLSPLFAIPFKLETDSDEELEIVTPPFLIADTDGAVNKDAADLLYGYYKDSAQSLRNNNYGKKLSSLNMVDAGFGNVWKFTDIAQSLIIEKTRGKHQDSDDQIYSQMNISLSPEEISEFTENASEQAGENSDLMQHFAPFAQAFNEISFTITDAVDQNIPNIDNDKENYQPLFDAAINMSRGLANLLAIPSILYNALHRNEDINNSLHSAVKETFGIWVKDTVPNIVSSNLINANLRSIMASALNDSIKKVGDTIDKELRNAFAHMPEKVSFLNNEKEVTEYNNVKKNHSAIVLQELESTFKAVIGLLEKYDTGNVEKLAYEKKFLEEDFAKDSVSGLGVRKETFLNIQSGTKRKLHLAEIRGDDTLTSYLAADED